MNVLLRYHRTGVTGIIQGFDRLRSDSAGDALKSVTGVVWAPFGVAAYSRGGNRPSSGRFRPSPRRILIRQEEAGLASRTRSLRRLLRVGEGSRGEKGRAGQVGIGHTCLPNP